MEEDVMLQDAKRGTKVLTYIVENRLSLLIFTLKTITNLKTVMYADEFTWIATLESGGTEEQEDDERYTTTC